MLTIAEGAMYEAIHIHTLTFLHVFSIRREDYSVYCPKFVSLRMGGGGGGGVGGRIERTIT